jgi:linoleate 10R-lipoxygenase
MLRRFSTTFKRSKDTNGEAEPTKNGKESKRFSKVSTARKSTSNEESHAVKRAEVVAVFEKYAQAIHASREPLPNQTGDGTYLKHDHSSGLINDIKALGFRDVNTVKDLIKSKASGELVDDKTMLMERIIQVRPIRVSVSHGRN